MAQGLDSKELKRAAIAKMHEGRTELDAEIQRMRVQYNPKRIARSAMEQHAVAIIGVAFGVSLVVTLLLSRHHSAPESEEKPGKKSRGKEKENKEKNSSLVGTLLGSAAKSAAPLAVRWFLNSRFMPGAVPPPAAQEPAPSI
jgi:hypothetical protein